MIPHWLTELDDVLRGRKADPHRLTHGTRHIQIPPLIVVSILLGIVYGVFMGLYAVATFVLCPPSFFVINSVAGLREDFGQALRAVVGTQSCVTVVLASLAPFTAVWYLSSASYRLGLLFNALMFGIASLAAHIVVRRYYGPLIRRSPRHRLLLRLWFVLYVFVDIQMAWVLRPFIGDPNQPVAFFRAEAWGSAYLVIAGLLRHALDRAGITPALRTCLFLGLTPLALPLVLGFYLRRASREKH
ncbi:MAG: hypothetical protein MUC88_16810 [Planctomycetes bacterium]|jgi:hypothetical protein|nr:hypothetical protein [Planctomycetota bacterium]